MSNKNQPAEAIVNIPGGRSITSADDLMLAAQQTATRKRVVYEYTIPEAIRGACDGIESIGIIELDPSEEVLAAASAKTDHEIGHCLMQQSLRLVVRDGKERRVSLSDGTTDVEMQKLGPKGRALLTSAYGDINTPTMAQRADFVNSRRTRTL